MKTIFLCDFKGYRNFKEKYVKVTFILTFDISFQTFCGLSSKSGIQGDFPPLYCIALQTLLCTELI